MPGSIGAHTNYHDGVIAAPSPARSVPLRPPLRVRSRCFRPLAGLSLPRLTAAHLIRDIRIRSRAPLQALSRFLLLSLIRYTTRVQSFKHCALVMFTGDSNRRTLTWPARAAARYRLIASPHRYHSMASMLALSSLACVACSA